MKERRAKKSQNTSNKEVQMAIFECMHAHALWMLQESVAMIAKCRKQNALFYCSHSLFFFS
jgi:hypothetical protein